MPARPSTPARSALKALCRKLPGCILTDEASRFKASLDNLRLSFLPDAVVRVREAADVGTLLKIAHRYRIPVTPRGAGSSATGAAVPIRGGWVLDLSGLTGMQLDPVARLATVGAGVVTARLQERAEAKGLFFPPDPSSRQYSTIGGNIACNAGGMRCLKYGVTRDYILGIQGFLADGSPVQWGLPLRKYVSGLNLRDLWIGSEGTLGVVTSATVKLIPFPASRWVGMFAFKTEASALKAVVGLLKEGMDPSMLEFLDRQSVICAENYTGKEIFPHFSGTSILLVELDGRAAEIREQRKCLLDYMTGKAKALAYKEARAEAQAEKLLQIRRTCSQAMFSLGDTKLNEDVVVPIRKQAELIRYTLQLKKEIGLPTPTFGHAGDGNLHVHIMYCRSSEEACQQARIGIEKLMRKVVELGGAITGEHGIGLAKAPFMGMQHTKSELAVMRAVKDALDPKGILNPGKMFEPFEVWNHTPVKVKLPWDHR